MPDFLTDPLVLRTGWTLVHFVWQGALVALLLALALRLLRGRSPQARYAAALMALALMAALPVATWHALPAAPAASVLEQSTPPSPTDIGAISPVRGRSFSASREEALPLDYSASLHQSPGEAGLVWGSTGRGRGLEQVTAPNLSWNRWLEAWLTALLPYLVLGWLGGVLVLGVRLTGGWIQVQRLRRCCAHPVEGGWPRRFEALARQMGLAGRIRLLRSTRAEGPLALGYWRPAVIVPGSLLTGLPPEQVEAILAHELAHIRRYDYAVNLAQSALEVLLFYHPAVWWASAQVRREREHCCDDLAAAACRSRLTYARALTGLEALRGPRLAPGAADGSLLHRIRRIVAPAPPGPSTGRATAPLVGVGRGAAVPPRGRATAALVAVGVAAVLLLGGIYFPSRVDAEAAPPPVPGGPAAEIAAPFDTSLTAGSPVRIALPGDTLVLGLPHVDTLRERIRIVNLPRLDSLRRSLFIWADSISDVAALVHLRKQAYPFAFGVDSLRVDLPEFDAFADFAVDSLMSSLLELEMDSLEVVFPRDGLWEKEDGPHMFFYDPADTLEHPPEIIFRMEPPHSGEPPLPPEAFEQFQEWEFPDLDELMAPYRAFVDTTDWQALRRQIRESMEEARRAREEALIVLREYRQEWQQEYQQELKERRRETAELERERREELEEELEQRRRELREWHENQERREALREFREELRREQGDLRETQAEALREAAEALGEQAEQLREELAGVEDDSDLALERRRLLREQIRVFEQQARRLRDRARELEERN